MGLFKLSVFAMALASNAGEEKAKTPAWGGDSAKAKAALEKSKEGLSTKDMKEVGEAGKDVEALVVAMKAVADASILAAKLAAPAENQPKDDDTPVHEFTSKDGQKFAMNKEPTFADGKIAFPDDYELYVLEAEPKTPKKEAWEAIQKKNTGEAEDEATATKEAKEKAAEEYAAEVKAGLVKELADAIAKYDSPPAGKKNKKATAEQLALVKAVEAKDLHQFTTKVKELTMPATPEENTGSNCGMIAFIGGLILVVVLGVVGVIFMMSGSGEEKDEEEEESADSDGA